MPAVTNGSDIATLTQLYLSSSLNDPPFVFKHFPPNSSINDRVGFFSGDITSLRVDAIVNAANNRLLGGGGVDGAIHRAAGPGLRDECSGIGGCGVGRAVATKGYELPAEHIIHTVGPVYRTTMPAQSERELDSCYKESLKLAVKNNYKTVAFSAISTGAYGYPSAEAAKVACEAVRTFLDSDNGALERVIFVTFEIKEIDAYKAAMPMFFPPVSERSVHRRVTDKKRSA